MEQLNAIHSQEIENGRVNKTKQSFQRDGEKKNHTSIYVYICTHAQLLWEFVCEDYGIEQSVFQFPMSCHRPSFERRLNKDPRYF